MKVTKLFVERQLRWEKIREVCIEHDYYTRGTVAEYENMFKMAKNIMQPDDYIKIAEDIFEHSNVDRLCNEYGVDEEEVMRIIISNLVNASWSLVDIRTEGGLGE